MTSNYNDQHREGAYKSIVIVGGEPQMAGGTYDGEDYANPLFQGRCSDGRNLKKITQEE
jgi:hypothetical protein